MYIYEYDVYMYIYIYMLNGIWWQATPAALDATWRDVEYRGTSLMRTPHPLEPYRRPMSRVLGGSKGGRLFLIGEVNLYGSCWKGIPRASALPG